MQKYILLLLFLWTTAQTKSQNLIVGFFLPNEVITLNSGSYTYDTVFIFNNATLNIVGPTQFVVNDIIAVLGTGKLNVSTRHFEVNNIFSTQDYSITNLTDTLLLPCNLYVSENSTLAIDQAELTVPMTYKSQYSWHAFGSGKLEIRNSNCHLGSGALDGSFTDSAVFRQINNNYYSTMLPMTMGVAGNAVVQVDSCSDGMEFVLAENADVRIQNSDFFMIWYTFDSGDSANFDYPPANSVVYPLASHIAGSYHFSDSLSNVSGIGLRIDVQNTDGIFWGIISKDSSHVTVNNSLVMACGFYFAGKVTDQALGFQDNQLYASYVAPFSDRTFTLNNSMVRAWNFYPADSTMLTIDSCLYGESIGFGNSTTNVYHSFCDGTGGYFGAMDQSRTYVYQCELVRTTGNAQIINVQDNSATWIHQSSIIGGMVQSGASELYLGNTRFTSNPVVNDQAFFAEAWIDSLNPSKTDTILEISGKVWNINGPFNTSALTRYVLAYSQPDSSAYTVFHDTISSGFNMINSTLLGNWNTQGLIPGDYRIWLSLYVDGIEKIRCNRPVTLEDSLPLGTISTGNFTPPNPSFIFPNPGRKMVWIHSDHTMDSWVYVRFTDALGRNYVFQKSTPGTNSINVSELNNGVYFYKILGDNGLMAQGKFLKVD